MSLNDVRDDIESRWAQSCKKFATSVSANNVTHNKIENMRNSFEMYKDELKVLKSIEKDPILLAAISTREGEDKIRLDELEKAKLERSENIEPKAKLDEEPLPVVDLEESK